MSVSVIMTCHNEAAYVEEAIRSVVTQTAYDRIDEIIIVDDGSTDGSPGILLQLAKEIRKLRIVTATGVGLPAARNLALAEAVGAYIAILDGDDLWTPDKLERQLPAIEGNPRVGLVYGDFHDFTADDRSDARLIKVRRYGCDTSDLLKSYFIEGGPIVPSTTIIRREVFDTVGPFDPEVRLSEDAEMFLRVAERWAFQHVPGGFLYKRQHGRNLTRRLDALLPVAEMLTERFVARNPRLGAYVGKRLARRHGKSGSDCLAKGERAKALEHFRKALRLDPFFWRTYAYLVIALLPPRLGTMIRHSARGILRAPKNGIG